MAADSLAAAIDAGADAVYFGVEGLNMRSRSSANLTPRRLLRHIVAICREKNVNTYLTVNTIAMTTTTSLRSTPSSTPPAKPASPP